MSLYNIDSEIRRARKKYDETGDLKYRREGEKLEAEKASSFQ